MVITLTRGCKKKSNGTYHRLNARRFEQFAGKHFEPTSTAASETNDTTRIVLVHMLLANSMARMYDVKGAFLTGKFDDSIEIFHGGATG